MQAEISQGNALRQPRRQRGATTLDQLPPHDLESERDALACILDSDQDDAVARFAQLNENLFYGQAEKIIFRALTKIEADAGQFNTVELL